MKKTYRICIRETLEAYTEVEALDRNEAYIIVKDMYRKEEIVLDSSNYICTEFIEE